LIKSFEDMDVPMEYSFSGGVSLFTSMFRYNETDIPSLL